MMTFYVVFDHPTDYPEWYVCRPMTEGVFGDICCVSEYMSDLYDQFIYMGKTFIHEGNTGDPVIIGTWI